MKACQRLIDVFKSSLINLRLILPSVVVCKFVSRSSVETECRVWVNDSSAWVNVRTKDYLTTFLTSFSVKCYAKHRPGRGVKSYRNLPIQTKKHIDCPINLSFGQSRDVAPGK